MHLSTTYRCVVALPATEDLHLTLPQQDLHRLQQAFQQVVTLPNGEHPKWWRPAIPETIGDALRSRQAPDSFIDQEGVWHAPHLEESDAYLAWSHLQLQEYSRTLQQVLSEYEPQEPVLMPIVVDTVEEHMQRWLQQFPAPESRWLEQWLAWLGTLVEQPRLILLHCYYG